VPRLIGRGPATWGRRLFWFIASAIPVGLMMAVTNYLTQDIAPAAIFWAVPLALYLAAFSLEFARFSPLDYGSFAVKVVLHCVYGVTLFGVFLILVGALFDQRIGGEPGHVTFLCVVFFMLILMVPFIWLPALQPLSALVLVFAHTNMFTSNAALMTSPAILLHLTCFYWSARLCLGMLAKDRPASPALTTYYTWIGIGGLAGGLFTLLIAPWLFRSGYREYAFLTALACTVRPAWFAHGLSDWLLCLALFNKRKNDPDTPNPWPRRIALAFDFGLALVVAGAAIGLFFLRSQVKPGPLVEGVNPFFAEIRRLLNDFPLVIALVLTAGLFLRPLRFGLALTAIVAFCFIGMNTPENTLVRDRNAFGPYRVTEKSTPVVLPGPGVPPSFTERTLVQGSVNQGSCITDPPELLRFPTTYYHRAGPVGQVMRRLEWWRLDGGIVNDRANLNASFWLNRNRDNVKGDARLAATLIALGASPLGGPMAQMTAAAWSEPPFAFVGLGTGTMYTYARPFQWVDAYELDPAIIALSTQEPPMFHYFQSAEKRGVRGKIFPGDARRNLTKPGREGFYHVLFVDAFNSDAIPTHLLTAEAIDLYFQKLMPEGVICIHTSNRHVDLTAVLERIAQHLNISMREINMNQRIPDAALNEQMRNISLFHSQWVVLARSEPVMQKWMDAGNFGRDQAPGGRRFLPNQLWTDEQSSVLSAVRTDRGAGWPRLIYAVLIMLLFFGIFLGLIEITYSMRTAPVVKK
jgi:hypothetical protein